MLIELEVLEEAFADHNPKDSPMGSTSHIQQKLNEWSQSRLFTAEGDELVSAKKYYANGLDALLAAITKAAIADGADRNVLMQIFTRHAEEVSRQ